MHNKFKYFIILLSSFLSVHSYEQYYDPPSDKSPETFDAWWENFQEWRDNITARINLTIYENVPEIQWARTSFIQPQVMMHDKYLYDRVNKKWTVSKYLQDLNDRYGGIDSVLLWPTYPNIGVDDRNQFDMMESLPGGIDGLRQCVEDFHSAGVRVLLPYNPWDQFTRDYGRPDHEVLVDIIKASNSDGMNGDTMNGVNSTWWEESIRQVYPIALEPEILFGNEELLSYDVMSWGYWTSGAKKRVLVAPGVSKYKALTKNMHMHRIVERWAISHTNGLQQAFFNGMGFETWENVWGIWNGIVDRDGELIRRAATILRQFGPFFQGESDWIPHVPVTSIDSHVYVSQFSRDEPITDEFSSTSIWLLVNRDFENDESVSLALPCQNLFNTGSEIHWFDLYHGLKLQDVTCNEDKGTAYVQLNVEGGGLGAIMATVSSMADTELNGFLNKMADMTKIPLHNYNNQWKPLQQVKEMFSSERFQMNQFTPDENSILIQGTELQFDVIGNCIEGDRLPTAIDVQFPWENHPQRIHIKKLNVSEFYLDKYPVTNSDYKLFLDASGWRPNDNQNWLRHWNGNDLYPEGWEKKPVTWVSIQDATEYCAFYGKRLPTSWEWHLAAQGDDGRPFPWGFEMDESRVPVFSGDRVMPPPDDVDAHPSGASPFGAEDMVGNIYQWTDVYSDEHTSRAVLRGYNHWRPNGMDMKNSWYFPIPVGQHRWFPFETPGPLYEHNTLLLLDEGLDRSGGIGFRCAADPKMQ